MVSFIGSSLWVAHLVGRWFNEPFYPVLTLDAPAETSYKQKPAISTASLPPNGVLTQNAELYSQQEACYKATE